MSCRFCVNSPTIVAPAVVARPRISSHGSGEKGWFGSATETRTAFSLETESSSRCVSNALPMRRSQKQRLHDFLPMAFYTPSGRNRGAFLSGGRSDQFGDRLAADDHVG